jgi:prophage regulatory protein
MAILEDCKLLRLEAVISLIGMKRSWILQKAKEGKFPRPLRLGPRVVAWRKATFWNGSRPKSQWIKLQCLVPI